MNMKYTTIKTRVAVALGMFLMVSQNALAYSEPVVADYAVNTQLPAPQYYTPVPDSGYADPVTPYGSPAQYPTPQYYTPVPTLGYSDPVIPGTSHAAANNGSTYVNNFVVATLSGTSTNTTTGHLYGSWANATALQTTTWFEYGTNANAFSNQTTAKTQYLGSGNFDETVFGLTPGTTYYYRAAAQSSGIVNYGAVRSFRTQSVQVTAPVVTTVRGTTTQASNVGIINNLGNQQINTLDNANVCAGDVVNFTLNYQNTTNDTISNAILVATMPQGIDYVSSTAQATFDQSNHTVTVFIGTLAKSQTGIVYLQGKANSMANGAQSIATRVDFTYTKADGTNATTTSYIMHSGAACNNLGANALSSGFLPTSFGGWLLLVIIICAIIFVARKYFGKKEEDAHGAHH
jgi:uncharacterized repeat protein (TIGR01451 family)